MYFLSPTWYLSNPFQPCIIYAGYLRSLRKDKRYFDSGRYSHLVCQPQATSNSHYHSQRPFFLINTSTFLLLLFTPSYIVISNTPTEFTTNCSSNRNHSCVQNLDFFSIDYVPSIRGNIDTVRKHALTALIAMETDTRYPKPNCNKQ